MWVAGTIVLMMGFLALYSALRQAASLERRLQQVLCEEAQHLAQLRQRLVQLDRPEVAFPTIDADASVEATVS